MRRREFLSASAASAIIPLAARAQQIGHLRHVAMLLGGAEADSRMRANLEQFKSAFTELGWIDGQNVHIDYRWGASDPQKMETFAKEVVGLNPDVIIGHTTQSVQALQRETKSIPIIFMAVSDPVGSGFVESLSSPGGNTTGFVNIESSVSGKWIELLKELVPSLRRVLLMFNPQTAPYFDYYLQPFVAAGRVRNVETTEARIHTIKDIEHILVELAGRTDTGLAIMPDAFTSLHNNFEFIVSLAARYRVPTIYPYRYMVGPGGLISYGIDTADLFRRAASYVDRILKGMKPADLPVQLPTRFEMAVNLKTARTVGVEIPPTLLAVADEVIE